jgi:threonine aldolase
MIFTSDNVVGASPKVLEALVKANGGALPSYGNDPITKRVEAAISEIFERPVTTFLVHHRHGGQCAGDFGDGAALCRADVP